MYDHQLNFVKIFRFFSPIRIIEIITLLSLTGIYSIQWQSENLIFYAFFLIIGGSIIFEGVFDKEGFRKGIKKSAWKYYSGVGIQFTGVAVSALASFNEDPQKVPLIIGYSLLLVGIGGGLEAFHILSEKKLKDIRLSPVREILFVIGFVILIFFFGLYTVLRLIPLVT